MACRHQIPACIALLLLLAVKLAADPSAVFELQTSSYYELVTQARSLGIEETGGVPDLRQRIAEKLGVTLPEKTSSDKTITIESAQQAEVIAIDAPATGKLIHLSGDLRVTLVDNKLKVTHLIEAGELWYDQDSGEMTARGNVVYIMIRETSRESFRGDSLNFRLSDSQGVFYGGASERMRTVADKSLPFRYQGEAIRRSANDVVLMDSGSITSSLTEDPYYHIEARRIWVLRPGEWGLQNAVLYLGRIPVFWFPFYFQPGDDPVFNPVLSFSDAQSRRGTAFQTTTYIFGKKTRSSSPLSFLQMEDSGTVDGDKILKGWFLTRGKSNEPAQPSGWSLKVLVDFYSRLGVLSGVDAVLPGWGPFKTFKFAGGLGITRNVTTTGSTFTSGVFDTLLSTAEQNNWNGSWIGTLYLPFRWGGTLEMGDTFWNVSLQADSDPLFWGDLMSSRNENFSMLTFLGLGSANPASAKVAMNSLQWKGNLDLPAFMPDLRTNLQGSWNWNIKATTPALVTEDPLANFFVPTQLLFPNVSILWGGDLLKPATTTRATSASTLPELLLPEAEKNDVDLLKAPEEPSTVIFPELGMPSLLSSLPFPGSPKPWTQSLTWSVNPVYRVDTRYDNSLVLSAQDFQSEVQSSRWNGAWDGKLGYNLGQNSDVFAFSSVSSLHQQIQDTWYVGPSVTPATQALLLTQDKSQTSSLLLQNLNLSWSPFVEFAPLSSTSLSYAVSGRLWEHTGTEDKLFDGTVSSVSVHQVSVQTSWLAWEGTPSVTFGARLQDALPPLTTNVVASSNVDLQLFWARLSSKIQYQFLGTVWTPDPWLSSLELTPWKGFSLKESFQYDLALQKPLNSTTDLSWAGWSVQYRHMQTLPYLFDSANRKWKTSGVSDFLPQGLDLRYSLAIPLTQSWENRQSIAGNLSINWPMNLQQISQMPLSITFSLQYKLFRFVDLQVSESLINRSVFRYFPALVDSFGIDSLTAVNPITDLIDSLSVWDDAALRRGGFKMSTLNVGLVHYLSDWQIKLDYSGSPQLSTGTNRRFQWSGTLSLLVQWYPVPELKTQLNWDRTGVLTIPRNSP